MPSNRRKAHVPLKVFLVGSHPLALRYLRTLLSRIRDLRVAECAESPSSKVRLDNKCSLLIVDGCSFGRPMRTVISSLKLAFPGAWVVVLGLSLTESVSKRLFSMGVRGYVCYKDIDKSLISVLRRIHSGDRVFPEALPEKPDRVASGFGLMSSPRLTPQEQKTFDLLTRHMSNKEIGSRLGISERTVKFHLANIYQKTGIHDRDWVAHCRGISSKNDVIHLSDANTDGSDSKMSDRSVIHSRPQGVASA